ncbi:MAG TPA: DUF2461 domain-containing protein [Magnetospirillum sp.]|jgi:uncharacterized protein (TIGR02453 family)|nr:DUF2461 domain-containing protein [Magnetospirillum sp.]
MNAFTGLPAGLPAFLAELAANNERDWFTDHKDEYLEVVQAPLRRLVSALAPAMLEIDPGFDTNPKGAAVSRIHRDVRFSRDKSPYRVNQWICFKRPGEGWQGRPAYFLEIGPAGWRFGMGTYAAPPSAMKELRGRILAQSERFARHVEAAQAAGFTAEGEPYARASIPAGLPLAAEPWFRFKNAYLVSNRPLEPLLFATELVNRLTEAWRASAGLYEFLAA